MDRIPFQTHEIQGSIPGRFARIVKAFGARTAIRTEAGDWDYAQLDEISGQIARSILRRIGTDQQPVLLLFDHDAVALAALLGVLKSGHWFVALDPDYPASWSSFILHDLQARLMVTDTRHSSQAHSISQGACEIINTDTLEEDSSAEVALPASISPEALEAVFYTSGSTGHPKGVERNHRFILHRIWLETNDYHIQPDDKISLIHNLSFGASQTDVFNALMNGAQLCLYDIRKRGLDGLASWIHSEQITIFHAPAELFRRFLEGLSAGDYFPGLRQITPSGRLYRADVERIRPHIRADCVLIQRLASTETGMVTRLIIDHQSELVDQIMPVGYPVEGMQVLILGDSGDPLGFNATGEIAVVSSNLASGYWRQPELTRKAFLPALDGSNRRMYRLGDLGRMRADGCLELVGRKDKQVKIRGFRVEPGEIEAALLDLAEVKEALVIARSEAPGENRLVAYVVPVVGEKISIRHLRKSLNEKLPEYMLPALFIPLEKLPLTSRGKIDQAALPDPGTARPELDEAYLAPRTETETTLSEIWSLALHIVPVGITDNFFELGGHSLVAAHLISATNRAFKTDLPLRTIFDAPTVEKFAALIESVGRDESEPDRTSLETALEMLGY